MYKFGKGSQEKLSTCHKDIQLVMSKLIKIIDFSVICGHREEAAQRAANVSGMSKVEFPNSKHNSLPSMAIDIAPYPIDWEDTDRFYWLAGLAVGIAEMLYESREISHKLRFGGDWDKDGDIRDQTFMDLPHLEIYKP